MINATLLLLLVLMCFWKICDLQRTQNKLTDILKSESETLELLVEFARQAEEREQNTIKALNDICMVLNQSFSSSSDYMNLSTATLHNIAVCMIPFIDSIRSEAIAKDDFEKAQECSNIIKNLREIINYK